MLFISHKHSDREIAETIARFIRNSSAGKVRVHLSSSPHFEGPRLGQPINSELKNALAISEVVILVFTTDTEDWSYCMWECGVATNPRDERPTSVVVVQCTDGAPKPYGDQLRVDARDLDSVHMFVKTLLTGTDLMPNRDEPITGFSPDGPEVSDFAADLHADLAKVLPTGGTAGESTPASPFVRIFLADVAAHEVRTSYLAGEAEQCLEILQSKAEVVAAAFGAENLLGMVLSPGTTLGDVLASWRSDHGNDAQPRWWWSLTEQMEAALAGKMRPVKWATFHAELGRAHVPYVAATRKTSTGVEFDVYVVPFAPRPIPVKDKMITRAQMYLKDEASESLEQLLLMSLIKEMADRGATRLPILDHGRPVAIVHKATINDFLVQAMTSGGQATDLSLQALVDQLGGDVADSYADVSIEATIEEAMNAMGAKPGCQDVFVTSAGVVVGWLPNVVFIQDSQD